MKLDKKDKQLLNMLYHDSRASCSQMGKKLRLGGLAVERRLRALQEDGAIELLSASVDMARMGFEEYRLYFKFDVMDSKTEADVLQLFESYPRTGWGVVAEGEYDVLWRIFAKGKREVEEASFLMMETFGDRIVEKTVVSTIHETYLTWDKAFGTERVAEKAVEKTTGAVRQELDLYDVKILACLHGNAREKSTEIAKKVGITPDTVNYRLRKLAKDGYILGYTAWFDARKLGFNYYKILISFKAANREGERAFINHCLAQKEVVYINKTMGSWDAEVDVIVANNEELHDFTRRLKNKFGEMIGKHRFITVVQESTLNPLREYF